MSAIVVVSCLPGEQPFRSRRYRTNIVMCDDDLSYWRSLDLLWASAFTIVNVEHDMECSDRLIDELVTCREPLCTHAYRIHHAAKEPGGHYAHRVGKNARYGGDWWKPGEPWAEFSGIGFAKIAPEARTGTLPMAPWHSLEMSVADATSGRWHIHSPGVEHRHR